MKTDNRMIVGFLLLAASAWSYGDCLWQAGPSFPAGPRTSAGGVNANGYLVVVGGRPFVGGGAAVDYLAPGATAWNSAPPLESMLMQPAVGADELGRIIVAGGYFLDDHFPFFFPVTDGFFYDLTAGAGDGIAPMTHARAFHAFASDAQHRLYVIGGRDANNQSTAFAERYDPLANNWQDLAPLPQPRDHSAAVYDGQGRILVIGGLNANRILTATVFAYDIAANAWSEIAAEPAALQSQSAVLGADGHVFLVGGSNGDAESRSVFVFDPLDATWFDGPPLAVARAYAAIAVGDEGRVCVMGGAAGSLGTATVARLDTRPPAAGEDCNGNGLRDECDIAWGRSADGNGDGIPDECDAPDCSGDLNGDRIVDLNDLAQLLGHYGMTRNAVYTDGDLDGDGDVDLGDLGQMLSLYGTAC